MYSLYHGERVLSTQTSRLSRFASAAVNTRLSYVSDTPWELVLAYDRDSDRLVIGQPETNRTKLVSVVISRYSDSQHSIKLRCPKLQRVNYDRVITTSIYPRPSDMAEEVLDKLELTARVAVKEYEASGRALWT